jgi:hypothetical protein
MYQPSAISIVIGEEVVDIATTDAETKCMRAEPEVVGDVIACRES